MSDFKREVKIQKLVETYGINEEKANYIIYTDDVHLSIEDLKMKYDNPNIGILPDWLSEESLHNMICKSIHSKLSSTLLTNSSFDDLYQDIQIFVRIRSNKLKNFGYLKCMINNYLLNVISDNKMRQKYIQFNLETPIKTDKGHGNDRLKMSDVLVDNNDDSSIISLIDSIVDKDVKVFLIVVGYLLCRINILKPMYEDVINNSKDSVKSNLKKLEIDLIHNDRVDDIRKYENHAIDSKRKIINTKTIIAALELNNNIFDIEEHLTKTNKIRFKSVKLNATTILKEFKFYLANTIFGKVDDLA